MPAPTNVDFVDSVSVPNSRLSNSYILYATTPTQISPSKIAVPILTPRHRSAFRLSQMPHPPASLAREICAQGLVWLSYLAEKNHSRLIRPARPGLELSALPRAFVRPFSPTVPLGIYLLGAGNSFLSWVELVMKSLCAFALFLSIARGVLTASIAQPNPSILLASPLSNATVNATVSK